MTALIWNCTHCGQPVDDGDGWLQCDYVQADLAWQEAEDQRREESRATGLPVAWNLADLLAMPDAAWVATHKACDTSPNADYWFDIARVRTDRQLMHWTAHLMEKGWIGRTDWSQLLYRMLDQLGAVSP